MINLYEVKAARMLDATLLQECTLHLLALEQNLLSREHIARAVILFTEAVSRDSLAPGRDDFNVALRVLKHL